MFYITREPRDDIDDAGDGVGLGGGRVSIMEMKTSIKAKREGSLDGADDGLSHWLRRLLICLPGRRRLICIGISGRGVYRFGSSLFLLFLFVSFRLLVRQFGSISFDFLGISRWPLAATGRGKPRWTFPSETNEWKASPPKRKRPITDEMRREKRN